MTSKLLRASNSGQRGAVAAILLAITLGLLAGIGFFTFGYARGASYLTNDPQACANCHVMKEQLDSWQRSSHRKAAVCNDCHTPPGFVPKYATKALNGFFHSLAFTTQHFPEQIQIGDRNRRVTESSCLKCHADIVQGIRGIRGGHRADISCIQCHARVGHM